LSRDFSSVTSDDGKISSFRNAAYENTLKIMDSVQNNKVVFSLSLMDAASRHEDMWGNGEV
jgi:hypothetical protein